MTDAKPRSLLKLGCLVGLILVALAASIGGGLVAYAAWQLKSITLESHERTLAATPQAESLHLELDASVARIVLSPSPAGTALRCEADFDPRHYRLESGESEGRLRIRFLPTGTHALALLRMKLGAEPPLLRIHLPSDQTLSLEGRLRGSFAAMEFAGTSLRSLDLELEGAAATVSFAAPLARILHE